MRNSVALTERAELTNQHDTCSDAVEDGVSSASRPSSKSAIPVDNNGGIGGDGADEGRRVRKIVDTIRAPSTPRVLPRSTRASELRLGTAGELESPSMRRMRDGTPSKTSYEGIAGHKQRRESGVVKPPTFEPKLSRTTKLRMGLEVDLSASERRSSLASIGNRKGVLSLYITILRGMGLIFQMFWLDPHTENRRASSVCVRPPTIVPRLNRSTALRNNTPDVFVSASTRRASAIPPLSSVPRGPSRPASGMSHTTTTTSAKLPTIVPRMNRTEELRAAKRKEESSPQSGNKTSKLSSRGMYMV